MASEAEKETRRPRILLGASGSVAAIKVGDHPVYSPLSAGCIISKADLRGLIRDSPA